MQKKFIMSLVTIAYMFGIMIVAQPAPVLATDPLPITCDNGGVPDPLGLECVSYTGLSKSDPRIVVGRIIKVALGLIGVIFTVLTVYAGFLWMTSAGNEEQVTKARGMITASVIGLVIILASYTITNFVLKSICQAAADSTTPCAY